jgi:hypothetical protein
VLSGDSSVSVGQKRKQTKVYMPRIVQSVLTLENSPAAVGEPLQDNTESEFSSKKQNNSDSVSTSRSADLAAAVD